MGELYGDLETVKAMLRPTDTASFSSDADVRLAALQVAVSAQIEFKTRRVFGGTATPTTRTVDGGFNGASDTLYLPAPVRSVTAVSIIGTYPETIASSDYVLWAGDYRGDYQAIRRTNGLLFPARGAVDRVLVTAVWSDEANGGGVPADITYAANYLIAELFKIEQASPAGFTGPDGATIPIRDPWKQEMVKTAIERTRVDVGFPGF